jgi:hypothetical protein
MIAKGELPMIDCAIFADTQSEPTAVYRHLDWLEKQLPFPVYRVTAGNLRENILDATIGHSRLDARPPFFVSSGGMLNRQCTQDFKIIPIVARGDGQLTNQGDDHGRTRHQRHSDGAWARRHTSSSGTEARAPRHESKPDGGREDMKKPPGASRRRVSNLREKKAS